MNDAESPCADLLAENAHLRAEIEALRASEAIHRLTLQNISDAVFVTDATGTFTFICPNANVIFGCEPDEIAALGPLHALLGDKLFDSARLAVAGELANIECEVSDKAGQARQLLVNVKRVAIGAGTVLYYMII
jgi:PAS domain S-box-containing protein